MKRPPSVAFAKTCKVCKKTRPVEDFKARGARLTKTCRECLNTLARGKQPKVATTPTYLPVVLPPEKRFCRRSWPGFVYADEEEAKNHTKDLTNKPNTTACSGCDKVFLRRRADQIYCSRQCRVRAKRTKKTKNKKRGSP